MPQENTAIIGLQFGDEAKAALAHHLSKDFNFIVRTGGGCNAGHSVFHNGKKFVHHLVPSGNYLKSNIKGYLGAGMVIHPESLLTELLELEKIIPEISKRIYVDPDAFVVLQKHIDEDKSKNKDIGSTNKGIGPAYTEKISRRGTKIRDLIRDNNEFILTLMHMGVRFQYVLENYEELKKSSIIYENSQSLLLDVNAGTYPYVTSGDCCLNSIINSGMQFAMPSRVFGVLKCYSTRVGSGPYPTEIFGEQAEELRRIGNEYGSTTGRARRIGFLDLPALKYAIIKSGVNSLMISKFDVLNGLKKVPVCIKYENKNMIVSAADFFDAKPIYTELSGWNNAQNINEIRPFIDYIENFTNCTVEYISYGTGENDIVKLSGTKETDLLSW